MNIWSGKKVRLCAPKASDSVLFFNDDGSADTDTAKLYDKTEFPYSAEEIGKRLEAENANKETDDFLFTIETPDGVPVGQITAFDCDKRSGSFKYGLFIAKKYQQKGYASDSARVLLNYYFNQLRYHRATAYVYSCNKTSMEFHEKLGFVKEGILRETSFFDGRYFDTVYYGMLDREFNSGLTEKTDE